MHDVVTNSSTPNKNSFQVTSNESSSSSFTNQLQRSTWHTSTEISTKQPDIAIDNIYMLMANDPSVPRRTPSAGFQKLAFPSRPDSEASSKTDKSTLNANRTMPASSRWMPNGNDQYIDTDNWSITDGMVNLKIGDGAGDDHSIRTPPKGGINQTTILLTQTSPLESASDASADSSPPGSDHQLNISHSRGSSTGTSVSSSHESRMSGTSNTLLAPSQSPPKNGINVEHKERPHSFSGGLPSADLRRLQQLDDASNVEDRQLQQQQQGSWGSIAYRENNGSNDQLSYPSLVGQTASLHRPQPIHPQLYDYRSSQNQESLSAGDDLQIDYGLQQRNFNPLPQVAAGVASANFVPGRPGNVQGHPYRQVPRGFPQHGLLPSPSSLGYPGHTTHLSLGSTQQLYDIMLPENHHPAVTRVQQQHNIFRGTHHHSTSDPSAIRDAATLALLNNSMQAFAPGMFQTAMAPPPPPPSAMPMYTNQFYGAQEAYQHHDVTAQAMAARLQAQYTGPYPVIPPQGVGIETALPSPSNSSGQGGPSANNRKLGLYKTELCRSWEEKGTCRYGTKCQFAHGEEELRKVVRHPKYKTEICRTFWVSGSCPYGKRCCFIHTELPANGQNAANGVVPTESGQQPPRPDGRARSLSTNSDPNDASGSLLARISAKRSQEITTNNNATASTPVEITPTNAMPFGRPQLGKLNTALDGNSFNKQQNKSAYPTFTSNGILLPAPENISAKSPAPVTAGPDLGRHNLSSRLEIVGYNNQQMRANKSGTSTNSNARHSFNGSDIDLSFSPSPPITSGHSYGLSSGDTNNPGSNTTPRISGHVRAGSAGNWGSITRGSQLAQAPYANPSSPAVELNITSPWSTTELTMGSSRLNEKAWV